MQTHSESDGTVAFQYIIKIILVQLIISKISLVQYISDFTTTTEIFNYSLFHTKNPSGKLMVTRSLKDVL